MFLIKLTYKTSLSHIDRYIAEHHRVIKKHMERNLILLSGPEEPRTGGMILFTGNKAQVWQMIRQDPFYTHRLASYQIIEWFCYDQSKFAQA